MQRTLSMASDEEDLRHKVQYPLDSKCYQILDEIGRGASAVVYKAICIPMNASVVAIKSIDLDQAKTDFDNVRREAKIMSLLSHPNILSAHCFFTVDRRLWVVMPFMSAGSLQSIITSSFPDGLAEPCIAVVLKETLSALAYLHDQGHLHRDVKAGNILMDSNSSVKLADFGVSASIYEPGSSSNAYSPSSLMLTDVAGTPYWMAPEVIHSHTGYSFKADIWSFGITALELAHGRPPLSHLPPSKSLLMKITTRSSFSEYDKIISCKNKKFSKSFKDMVGMCLDQEPSRRPSAEKLLKHSFFRYCKSPEFLMRNVLQNLPTVEHRYRQGKLVRALSLNISEEDDDNEENVIMKQRRISGWNFNIEGFELDPVFPKEQQDLSDNSIGKKVWFTGDTNIQERGSATGGGGGGGGGGEEDSDVSSITSNSSGRISAVPDPAGNGNETVLNSLLFLKKSLEDQWNEVIAMITVLRGKKNNAEMSLDEQVVENLRMQLENEKKKNHALELELEFLKLQY